MVDTALPQVCTKCGKVSPSPVFRLGPRAAITLQNCAVVSRCPYCGGDAHVPNGTYAGLQAVVQAIRSPEVTRDQLERLRSIAVGVSEGSTDVHQASQQVNELAEPLARAWAALGTGQAQLLVALIGIILMLYFQRGADEQAAKQNILAERQVQTEQRILEELQKMNRPPPAPEKKVKPKRATQPTGLTQTRGPNRRERRRVAAEQRRLGRNEKA